MISATFSLDFILVIFDFLKPLILWEFSPAVSAIVSTGQVEINDDNSSVTGNVIKVAWKKMSDVSGFEIVRSTQENGIYVKVGTVDGSKTSYVRKIICRAVCFIFIFIAIAAIG